MLKSSSCNEDQRQEKKLITEMYECMTEIKTGMLGLSFFHFLAPSIIALHVHVYVRVWNDFNAGIVSFLNELRSHCTNMAELTGSAY